MSKFDSKSLSFSSNNKFAICSSDGVLHVWDASSSTENNQFTPTSHLSATFTCLSWKIRQHRQQREQNRKRRKSRPSNVDSVTFEYIALGTAVGKIMVYDNILGEVISKFDDGHANRVNDICWSNVDSTLYSCSNDQHIMEWDMTSSAHKCKWKADKREVYSIKVGPYSQTLLSAGRIIKLWDLKTKQILKKFSGHTSPVISLSFINPSSGPQNDAPPLDVIDGAYFMSACQDDQLLSAWQIRSTKHKKTSLCSFSLPCEPRHFEVFTPQTKSEPMQILTVTDDGEIVLFSHTLNGPVQKPLEPSHTIKLCTEEAEPLNVISAAFDSSSTSDDTVISLAYGSSLKLVFEKIKLAEQNSSEIVLIRKDPSKVSVVVEQDKLKLRTPIQRKNEVSTLVPGVPSHAGATSVKGSARKRKKNPSIGESQLTMEERLNAMSVAKESDGDVIAAPPRADSFAILLSQGLQSNDRDVLNQVLQHGNDTLISNTVRGLPLPYVIPLIKEVQSRLGGSPEKCLILMKWMLSTFNCHGSYLMTLPSMGPLVNELYQLCTARNQNNQLVYRLGGKIDHILTQVLTRKEQTTEQMTSQSKPLYEFQEDSSDEQDGMMDGMMEDDYDEWDKFSDDEKKATIARAGDDEFEVLMDEDG